MAPRGNQPVSGPHRIVSLLPSATEILCGLGLLDRLVAVSHECDFPAPVRQLPRVTRTRIDQNLSGSEIDQQVREQLQSEPSLYSLDIASLQDAQPDLIVTQSLCDVCAVADREVQAAIATLHKQPEVIQLEPHCLEDVFECVSTVGHATNRLNEAAILLKSLRDRVSVVSERHTHVSPRPRVALLEWLDPPFSAGHWNPELIHLAGGQECLGRPGERSQPVTWQQISDADPEILVIACCGWSTDKSRHELDQIKRHPAWQTLRCVESGRVHLVDGSQYFNRPGPRLIDSLEILANLIHPSGTS